MCRLFCYSLLFTGIFFSVFLLQCSDTPVNAGEGSLYINEFMVRNTAASQYMDCLGRHGDWVELYNSGSEALSMGDFYISDRANNLKKKRIYDTLIPAGGYYLLWGGDTSIAGTDSICEHHNHLGFSFDSDDTVNVEMILVSNNAGNIIDSVSFLGISEATKQDTSYGRLPDGSGTWKMQLTPTPGAANVGYAAGTSSMKK